MRRSADTTNPVLADISTAAREMGLSTSSGTRGPAPADPASSTAPATSAPSADGTPRPLLVGECPSANGDRFYQFPLSGGPARVLSTLAGLPREGSEAWYWTLIGAFDTVNAMERHQRRWSAPAARASVAERILPEEPRVIICLGIRAHAALAEALDFPGARLHSKPRTWGTALWGDWGNWAAPWQIKTPMAQPERYDVLVEGEALTWERAVAIDRERVERIGCEFDVARGLPGEMAVMLTLWLRSRQVEYQLRSSTTREYAPWLVLLPHPSGLNRVLNDPLARERVGRVLLEARGIALDPDRSWAVQGAHRRPAVPR